MTEAPQLCPECSRPVVGSFQFCPSCGIPLVAAERERVAAPPPDVPAPVPVPGPGKAERRLVSVLFVDLVGFTTLSEELDPEDVREIQARYFEAARATVAHYRGSLEKFIGDAVMAVWGTPVARENDAERAVRAALEMVAKVSGMVASGAGLEARAAVTTGEAAVSFDIADVGMVTGDLVNTASRLQEAAERGTVLVDDATRRAVGGAIRFVEIGRKALKGKASRVLAWRAVEATPTTGPMASAPRAQFVGRQAELAALTDLLVSAIRDRRTTVASIIGVAGIGKSHLVRELERTTSIPGLRWFAGRPRRWGDDPPFAPLAEIVRRSAGVSEGDPTELVRRSLAESLRRLVADEAERGWLEPRLMTLLDPSLAIETEREELFAAWRRFLEAEAEDAAMVLLFDDLHSADAELLDFIDYFAGWSRRRPVLILTLARPELLESRPIWGAGLPHFRSIHLDRLDDREVEELLAGISPGLPADVSARLRRRAEGVPLYAVEMARMLTERGHGDQPAGAGDGHSLTYIPESLHALLAARIDALPPSERSLLLSAAVLGRRFRPEALAALAGVDRQELGRRLAGLVRRELLAMDDEPRSPGRGQLSFTQDLVREVAYATLSRRDRREGHLAVIAYLQSVPEASDAEPIAEHLVAAHAALGTGAPGADEIAGRARAALRVAADRARALHAPHRALGHLERALALTIEAAERAGLLEAAASAARAAARFEVAEERLREAIDLRDAAGEVEAVTRDRAQLASVLLQAQRSDTALAELEAAWSTMHDGVEGGGRGADLPAELARAYLLRGETRRAIEWAERALDRARTGERTAASAAATDARVTLGTALAQEGRLAEGLDQLRKAIDEAAGAGLASVELRARNNLAWLTVNDDPRATSETARGGLQLAEQLGSREWSLHLLDIATIVAIDIGEWEWALEQLREATTGEVPTVYRLDFLATQAIINLLRGAPASLNPIERLDVREPDLDPQALGWVEIARALAAMVAGDLQRALELAQGAARSTVGWDRAEALAIAGRAAAWNADRRAAAAALRELEGEPTWGNLSRARVQTLRAAVAALGGAREARAAASAWDDALAAWRTLELPLREAFLLVDRWRLLEDEADREAAARLAERLGAAGLARLLGVALDVRPPA